MEWYIITVVHKKLSVGFDFAVFVHGCRIKSRQLPLPEILTQLLMHAIVHIFHINISTLWEQTFIQDYLKLEIC